MWLLINKFYHYIMRKQNVIVHVFNAVRVPELTSSGEMMSLKLRRSSSSGKLISHVFGKFNSLMSATQTSSSSSWTHRFSSQQKTRRLAGGTDLEFYHRCGNSIRIKGDDVQEEPAAGQNPVEPGRAEMLVQSGFTKTPLDLQQLVKTSDYSRLNQKLNLV